MNKNNEYNSPKISNQRQGFGHIRNQSYSNITINNGVCHRGSEVCDRNATATCYKCCIAMGDTKLDIMFTPALTVKTTDNLDQIITQPIKQAEPEFKPELITKPPLPEPIKVAPIEEDAEDIPHFVNHVSESIIHQHSGNTVLHKHYPIYGAILGTRCFICNFPIIGFIICGHCESMFELSEKSN